MSIDWFDKDQTVIYHRIEGKWTWDEFHAAHEKVITMMNGVDHNVSILAEFVDENANRAPSGMLFHANKIIQSLPDNHNLVVIVGKNALARMAVVMLKQVIRSDVISRLFLVPSMDKAYEVLDVSPDSSVK